MSASTLVRNTDPTESHVAATAVSEVITRDRLLVASAFDYLYKATYRRAAEYAQKLDGSTDVARLESLRRRGSDLKALGWIEQDGRYDGQAMFRITDAGTAALLAGRTA